MFCSGDVVAGYTVASLIAEGGNAEVYLADGPHGPVALKVMRSSVSASARGRARFIREFELAAMLDHPHIVAVYERGEVIGPPPTMWIAMQYVAGTDSSVLVPHGRDEPPVPAIVRAARQIAGALDYAHSCDVLHRDVKPANVLLDSDGSALLTDFGIGQLIDDASPLPRHGRVRGSISYASPEVLAGQHLSAATDLYSLAATLVEWLTGLTLFPRSTTFAIAFAHLHTPPPSLQRRRAWLPSALDSVFAKALAKDPAARYDSCSEFVDIVARALRDIDPPHPQVGRRWWQRQRN